MFLKTIKLRNIEISPNLILAPMSGVTNISFRRLIKLLNPGAVGLVVTEFISIEAMTRRVEQSIRMMRFEEEERPLSIQIFGNEIERMAEAAKMVEDAGADIVDINSGCPVPKVVKKGGGCELMRRPEHVAKMLKAVRKAVSIPLTMKIRAGWDLQNRNAVEIAKIAEDSGVEMLTVHGRTRQEAYRGFSDWELIAEVASQIKIPVIGSGDVVCIESAKKALQSGVAGIMIGRAALSNPWIFNEIYCGINSLPYVTPPAIATVEVLFKYIDLLNHYLSEKAAMGRLKQLTSQITRRVHGSAQVRRELCMSSSLGQYIDVLKRWADYIENRGNNLEDTFLEKTIPDHTMQ